MCTHPPSRPLGRIGRLLWLLPIGLALANGCSSSEDRSPTAAGSPERSESVAGTVDVMFDFGDDREDLKQSVEIGEEATVEEVMRRLERPEVEISGSGTTALVRSIEGLGMTGGKGWLYEIDGQWAERGIGQITVDPGTEIRWRYGDFADVKAPTGAGESASDASAAADDGEPSSAGSDG